MLTKNAQETITTSISVVSVNDWETYRDELQPRFTLDETTLLKNALLRTAGSEERSDRSTSFSGRVAAGGNLGMPNLSAPSADGAMDADGGEGGDGDDADESEGDGENDGGDSSSASTGMASPSVPNTESLRAIFGNPGVDAHAQYQLAAALHQEIAILNRFVLDAAIPAGYRAFVVRMNIGVTGTRPDLPYDIITTMAFFGDQETATLGTSLLAGTPGAPGAPGDLTPGMVNPHVRVVPIIVSDAIESALRSDSDRVVEALALGLEAAFPNAPASASVDFQSQLEAVQARLANDYNSLVNVTGVGQNGLRVRIGSRFQELLDRNAGEGFTTGRSMLYRNYPVTALVLVPNEYWRAGYGHDLAGRYSELFLEGLSERFEQDRLNADVLEVPGVVSLVGDAFRIAKNEIRSIPPVENAPGTSTPQPQGMRQSRTEDSNRITELNQQQYTFASNVYTIIYDLNDRLSYAQQLVRQIEPNSSAPYRLASSEFSNLLGRLTRILDELDELLRNIEDGNSSETLQGNHILAAMKAELFGKEVLEYASAFESEIATDTEFVDNNDSVNPLQGTEWAKALSAIPNDSNKERPGVLRPKLTVTSNTRRWHADYGWELNSPSLYTLFQRSSQRVQDIVPEEDKDDIVRLLEPDKTRDSEFRSRRPGESLTRRQVLHAITRNDYDAFTSILPPRLARNGYGPFIWTTILETFAQNPINLTEISLPAPEQPRIAGAAASLSDDGKKAFITITGTGPIRVEDMRLTVKLTQPATTPGGAATVSVPVTKITTPDGGLSYLGTIESLRKRFGDELNKNFPSRELHVEWYDRNRLVPGFQAVAGTPLDLIIEPKRQPVKKKVFNVDAGAQSFLAADTQTPTPFGVIVNRKNEPLPKGVTYIDLVFDDPSVEFDRAENVPQGAVTELVSGRIRIDPSKMRSLTDTKTLTTVLHFKAPKGRTKGHVITLTFKTNGEAEAPDPIKFTYK